MRKIISPIIYILSVPVVLFLSILTGSIIIHFGFDPHTIFWYGDIDTLISVCFFSLLVFPLFTKLIVKFENSGLELFNDHIRQSSLFYISLTVLLILSRNVNDVYTAGFVYIWIIVISVILLLGIIINFLVLRKLSRNI